MDLTNVRLLAVVTGILTVLSIMYCTNTRSGRFATAVPSTLFGASVVLVALAEDDE